MAERLLQLSDAELEAALHGLGGALAYPVASSVVDRVHDRIVALPAPGLPWWERVLPAHGTFRRSAVLALAAVLLLAAVAAAVRFGVPGVRFVFEGPAASPSPRATNAPGVTPAPTPAPLGSQLFLGRTVTLDEARATADFPIALPNDPTLGAPDAVYFDDRIPGGHVALVWGPRPGVPAQGDGDVAVLLAQFRGRVERDFFEKVIGGSATTVEPVTVGGSQGWWLEGDPHVIYFLDARGEFVQTESRLVGNVLLWEQDGVTYRLESGLALGGALRIAESIG